MANKQNNSSETHRGSCLCSAVSFTVTGPLGAPDACHCSQCRKQSGHYWASTEVADAAIEISGQEHLTWYQASEKVRRGFCSQCGSFLFWKPLKRDWIAIGMGAFDEASQVQLTKHIFVADKGDYYTIADGLPQNQQ